MHENYDSFSITTKINILTNNNGEQYACLFGGDSDMSIYANFIIENNVSGIDRIVPVGRALDMDVVWDGYDVISSLSRVVDIK